MIHKLPLAFVVVAVGASGPLWAAPLPPEDPPEPPVGSITCDAGHLFEFPFNEDGGNFGRLHMASPSSGATSVPRNVEIVLGGFLGELDIQPPFLLVKLRDNNGAEVPSTRSGALLRPVALLSPQASYRVSVELANPDSCPGCGIEESFWFTTGDDVDTEPPRWSGAPLVQALVFSEQERQCGIGGGLDTTHMLLGRLSDLDDPDIARVSVAIKPGGAATTRVFDTVVEQSTRYFFRSGSEPLGLGDDVIVAVTPVDAAGNAGAATSVRVRARPFSDIREERFEDLADRQCSLPANVAPALPERVPTNARFVVDMPVEPVPLALVHDGGAMPLHPVEHLPSGQVLEPAEELPAGATVNLVALPCFQCACIGCDVARSWAFRVADGPDKRAPEPPVVLELLEDLIPAPAEEECHPDRSALIVRLEAGVDDTTAAEHLRYDAVIRLSGQLAVEVGRSLPALVGDDGTVAIRVDTSAYGRLLSQPFELDVIATDLAGNDATTTFVHDEGAGCSSTQARSGSVPLTGLALAALGVWLGQRRPRRSSVR